MSNRILIKDGKLVTSEDVFTANVLIENQKIITITEHESFEADRVFNAEGKLVLPGLVDPHVHLGYGRHPDDFDSETAAAAIGGVTTVISYNWVNDDYSEWFYKNRQVGENLAHIDFAFHFGLINRDHIENLEHLRNEFGVTSYKFYMQYMNNPGLKKNIVLNYADMYHAFDNAGSLSDLKICVHCEDPDLIERFSNQMRDIDEPQAWLNSRPGFTEARGVQAALDFACQTSANCYLVHISAKESVDLIRRHHLRDPKKCIWTETCPHYLTLTYNDMQGALGKVNPPLRTKEDIEILWSAISDDIIDTIGSDHIARSKEDKKGGIWNAKAGFPGSYAILPVMFSEGHLNRGLSLSRLVSLTSTNAARIFGLYPNKGCLMPGADADLVIIDPQKEIQLTSKQLPSGSEYSLYENMSFRGWPLAVLSRGKFVVENYIFKGSSGHGRYLERHKGT